MQLDFNDDAVEVRRRFDAAPELVFAAFTDPRLVRRWLKPSPDVSLDVVTYEFAPGGCYRFAYTTPGEPLMHVIGVFALIEPPSRIVFSWNIEPPDVHAGIRSEVRVAINALEDGCELLIRHVNLSRAGAPQRHAEGWRGALEGLASCLTDANPSEHA